MPLCSFNITISSFSTLFFFQCNPLHRHLHSFPTRRSSDLFSPPLPGIETGGFSMTLWTEELMAEHRCRSEEHTSELQSRFDLVCRLLLEKKKRLKSSAMATRYADCCLITKY